MQDIRFCEPVKDGGQTFTCLNPVTLLNEGTSADHTTHPRTRQALCCSLTASSQTELWFATQCTTVAG